MSTLEKALRVLEAFKNSASGWGVRELAAHLGYNPATVQRVLQTLKKHGFIIQEADTRRYRLGNVYFDFVYILQNSLSAIQLVRPFMNQLAEVTGETVHLNIIDRWERLCIDSIESTQRLRINMAVGERSPLYAGATSKCLIAFSPPEFIEQYLNEVEFIPMTKNTPQDKGAFRQELIEIRDKGYAVSLSERTEGIGSFSVPIKNYTGELLGALSLAIPEIRFNDNDHRDFCLNQLLEVMVQIKELLGFRQIASSPDQKVGP